mgnify:FL=1
MGLQKANIISKTNTGLRTMQSFLLTKMTKGGVGVVMVAGSWWGLGLHSGNVSQKTPQSPPRPTSGQINLDTGILNHLQSQFKVHYEEATNCISNRGISHLKESIGEIKFGQALLMLLSPTLTECEIQSIAQKEINEKNIETIGETSLVKNGDDKNISVLLYDTKSANDSVILKGCHILFSWTLFASVWSSVILFPVVTLWKVWDGAWGTVASIASTWLCTLCFRVPSTHELRRFVFRGLHKWFPRVDIIYEGEPPVDQTIFCCHPHGIFSVGTALLLDDLNYRPINDQSAQSREVGIVAAPFLRWGNPIFKCIADVMGIHIHGAGRTEFRQLLDSRKSCVLVPGGFSEATITCVGKGS